MSDFPSTLAKLLRLRPYAVELLHPRREIPLLSWLLLAAGVIVAGSAVLGCQPAWNQRAELLADQEKLQAAYDRAHDAGKPRVATRSGDRDGAAEAALVVAEVHRPWHQLFDQIEAAQRSGGGVHLLQLSVDPRFTSLQVVAEGRDLGGLVRFSGQMVGNGPIRSMELTHHEWRDTLGAHVVTASLQGELDANAGPGADQLPPAASTTGRKL